MLFCVLLDDLAVDLLLKKFWVVRGHCTDVAHLFLLMSLMMGLALFFLLHLCLETYP